ncbi:MAG TPA: SDR family oxidoreductase [Ohtaekwangia sp.]|nr:SDR family oxidoreductase [Ohtaekwangia sp.]
MFSLADKTAVITGGGSGIGKAIAELFSARGANVHVLELDAEAAKKTFPDSGDNATPVTIHGCDVSNSSQVVSVFENIVQQSGRIDVLVNSAGVAHIGKLDTTSESDFIRLFDVNVKGVFNSMKAAIAYMKAQKAGVILNVASVAATLGLVDRFAYSMTKGAVVSMTLSVAKDYINYNVRCNCISPARVHTAFVDGFLKKNYPGKEAEMFEKLSQTQPIGRMGQPAEIAALALYLCSDEAGFVTGCDYPIDGGFVRLNT